MARIGWFPFTLRLRTENGFSGLWTGNEARKSQGMKQKELLAQLQVRGVDLNASGLSKLEGQIRFVTDIELLALADILNVSVMWLLTGEEPVKKEP